jgi:hypothetical protein
LGFVDNKSEYFKKFIPKKVRNISHEAKYFLKAGDNRREIMNVDSRGEGWIYHLPLTIDD